MLCLNVFDVFVLFIREFFRVVVGREMWKNEELQTNCILIFNENFHPFCFLPLTSNGIVHEEIIQQGLKSKYKNDKRAKNSTKKINRNIHDLKFNIWNCKTAKFNLFPLFANIKAKLNKNIIFQITPLDLLIYASVSIILT